MCHGHKTKKPHRFLDEAFDKDRQRLTLPGVILVPSALVGLTALFGMGRGDPHRYCHLKFLGEHQRPWALGHRKTSGLAF